MKMQLDYAINTYNKFLSLCKKDECNLILFKHLGDLMYTIALHDDFEKYYGVPLHYFVKPKHEFLLKMYGITNYTVIDWDDFIRNNEELIKEKIKRENFKRENIDILEGSAFISYFQGLPIKGIPIICDGIINNFFQYKYYWGRRWRNNLGMDEFKANKLPASYPNISNEKITNIENCVLIAPEALTACCFDYEFWEIIINYFQRKGYTVIVNSKDSYYKRLNIISTYDLELTLEEVVALGINCKYVFSIRSGLNDVLIGKGKNMFAFYSANFEREYMGLNKLFEPHEAVNEILIKNYRLHNFTYADKTLEDELNKYLQAQKIKYTNYRKCQLLFKSNKRKSRLFRYKAKRIKHTYNKTEYTHNNLELSEEEKNLCKI